MLPTMNIWERLDRFFFENQKVEKFMDRVTIVWILAACLLVPAFLIVLTVIVVSLLVGMLT